MLAQPNWGIAILKWDVDNLEPLETAPGALLPLTIVPRNQPFNLKVSFSGQGLVWNWLEALGAEYTVNFYAEGYGVGAQDKDLNPAAPVTGNLVAGQGAYTAELIVPANALNVGVFRIACMVKFTGLAGMTGFYDTLLLEVYQP